MKTVIINKERQFENSKSLIALVEENGYNNFEIGEAITLYKEEMELNGDEDLLEDDVPYICHTGILDGDDEKFYALITTDYTDNIADRYRPKAFVDLDEGNIVLISFQEQ